MKLYWDLQNHKLVMSFTNTQQVDTLYWFLRDQVPVELRIGQEDDTTNAYVQQEAPAGYSVKFAIKKAGALSGACLVFAGTWVLNGAGTAAYYTATVNLNTVGLIADLAETETNYIGELTLMDGSGNQRDSTQFAVNIKPDVYRATESAPTAVSAIWPNFEWFTEPVSGQQCLRIVNDAGVTLAVLTPPGVSP